MTAHELARKLLEGPDVLVVKQGHEPNDDTFDEVVFAEPSEAWQGKDYRRVARRLLERKPVNETLPVRSVQVLVLR